MVFRETGLRSIWLGYPLVYIKKQSKQILAPVFLWPISIKVSQKRQNEVTIQRDDDAGAPLYNKAFDYWCIKNLDINPDDPSKDSLTEIDEKDLHSILHEIFKGFNDEPLLDTSAGLVEIPSRESLEKSSSVCLINSAIIGLIKWENQAVMRDLQEICTKDESSFPEITSAILSGSYGGEKEKNENHILETQRYFISKADRFQQQAIIDSREKPGVIIHGPPGTGKSDTIVNIVADCLARGEKILVICQKRAAIDVVYERLKKNNLDYLSVLVHDSNNDRKQVIQTLNEQLDNLRNNNLLDGDFERKRNTSAAEIELIESELDDYVKALLVQDGKLKQPYRNMKASYLSIREKWKGIPASSKLSMTADDVFDEELEKIEYSVRSIGKLYFESNPLNNPWRNRCQNFAVDRFLKDDISIGLKKVIGILEGLLGLSKCSNPFMNLPDNKTEFLNKFRIGFSLMEK